MQTPIQTQHRSVSTQSDSLEERMERALQKIEEFYANMVPKNGKNASKFDKPIQKTYLCEIT